MERKKIKFNTGFTLVESLVAISILSLSILATFTAVQNSIHNSTLAKDEVIAFWIAQEGMEYIKNIRDENALNSLSGISTNWLHGLSENAFSDPCYFGRTCTIESVAKVATACSSGFGSCQVLRQDPATGIFGYNPAWTATNFRREIQFQQVPNPVTPDPEVSVIINISWTTGGQPRSFQVTETLFNRQ